MSEGEQQLINIQEQLKKYAQELGQLNMMNNQFLQENEQLSIQIKTLQNKIAKKKHKIQQENKDKNIIHQKLVKAEKIKEQLEIKQTQIQAQKEEQRLKQQRLRQIQQHKRRIQIQKRNQLELQKIQQNKTKAKIQQAKNQKIIQQNAKKVIVKAQKQSNKPQVAVNNIKKQNTPKVQAAVKEAPQQKKASSFSTFYANSEKGDYQPPALFLDDEEDSEQDENTLEMLRQKLKQQKLNMAQEDDD